MFVSLDLAHYYYHKNISLLEMLQNETPYLVK